MTIRAIKKVGIIQVSRIVAYLFNDISARFVASSCACDVDAAKISEELSAYSKRLRQKPKVRRVPKILNHLTISLAKGEVLSVPQWVYVIECLRSHFGFCHFVAVRHKKECEHLHLVFIDVGLGGHLKPSSACYHKLQQICRNMESRYGLKLGICKGDAKANAPLDDFHVVRFAI